MPPDLTDTFRSTPFVSWSAMLGCALGSLRHLAGATEQEFLKIGGQMQEIYQQAMTISQDAYLLIEAASGERIRTLVQQLRQLLQELETYFHQVQEQHASSSSAVQTVEGLLKQIATPLDGVKKMSKHLYVFEVLVKIESARLGEMGDEFINLAQDMKKLSLQIKEKVAVIRADCLLLTAIIAKNQSNLQSSNTLQSGETAATIASTGDSLADIEAANRRFALLGNAVSSVSEENSNRISEIVQSMQFHDMYRQQVEHILEALSALADTLQQDGPGPLAGDADMTIVGTVGDICELQEAQLQFATTELHTAVTAIIGNLRGIGVKQRQMAKEFFASSSDAASGTSFLDRVHADVASILALLSDCARNNAGLAEMIGEVTQTISKMTGFVSAIEEIGQEIVQIALNARIKAAGTGKHGASLSVLAEEIGQLSNGAVGRTALITSILTEISSSTGVLSTDSKNVREVLGSKLTSIHDEVDAILGGLSAISNESSALTAHIRTEVEGVATGIERVVGEIHVHEQTRTMADEVLASLRRIIGEARALRPASTDFKEDLRLMEKKYTMDSERRIHESIIGARNPDVKTVRSKAPVPAKESVSDFGDNVDLF